MKRVTRKNFIWFFVLLAAILTVGIFFVIREFIAVSSLEEMPTGNFRVMLYLLIHNPKAWADGIRNTFLSSVIGTAAGFVFAVLLSYVRIGEPTMKDKYPVRFIKYLFVKLEKLYVTVIRGTPMMVQACIVYYAGFNIVRAMMPNATITEVNRVWLLFAAALITVSLNSAAYLAEVLRGGIESLDKGQKEAVRSLGMTKWQGMTRVIYPQVIRADLPSIINELINNIKGTSVLTVIGFGELMFATTSISGTTYQYLPTYLLAALFYLVLVVFLSYGLNILVDFFFKQNRFRRKARVIHE